MLVTLNDVMMIAEQQGIAIGAFNTPNLEALRAAIERCRGTGKTGYCSALSDA